MTHRIRPLETDDELLAASNVFRAAMVGFAPLTGLEPGQIAKLSEPGRTLGAFDGAELVGTTEAVGSSLTLPGGRCVPHAAVTHVGVLPSHTRRGIATALLASQLHDIRTRGEMVATLRASEATIYERFGYGVASTSSTVELDRRRAVLRAGVEGGGQVRLVDPSHAWDVLPRIYSENHPARPGSIARPSVWWQLQRLRAAGTTGARYVALHGDPGAETGFVRYHPVDTDRWFVSEQRTVVVDDFFAPTTEAYLGLVRFLLDLDLADRLVFTMLPLDDPLPWLLTDPRAARVTATRDETWLRVVDVAAALAARTYSGTGAITLHISDPLLQDNSGTFEISAGGVQPSTAAARLRTGPVGLAAALLGATPWRTLALTGLAEATDPEVIALADSLFRTDQAAHTGIYF
ncbi:GNAT family N-acetyltransferase [Mycolicibacterium parafortuitum]|uniref:Putative acetyltransferase involved in intracellular survival-related acetyltransferase [Gordonia sp. KTR9] n=1 Tax=Mycolicibacterium parafortuitum TaxID=39692 RepID=A0A375YPE4_MYCPF|nr:GNAT family N-acetyltransferase [Mycolicibacterium parafortuitum]ORB28478.1 GNAT family N-acetyltransferase [Mycolicibacterium parafortuitum]SRX82953.1 putative acetyltransferase involved in intracellular survival-related acetyltransferase [Gordonia sp. KTR9] [Mycolicibacterium parafortuitum]